MTTELTNPGLGLVDLLHSGGLTVAGGTGLSIPKPFAKPILLLKTYITGMFFVKDVTKLLEPIEDGARLTLIREPDNKYDEFAIMVKDAHGNKLGYIPRKSNIVIANLMDAGKSVYATIRENRWYGRSPDVTISLYMEE